MKKTFLFLPLVFVIMFVGGCLPTRTDIVMPTTYNLYKSMAFKSFQGGWVDWGTTLSNSTPVVAPNRDKMWFQGMYGTMLALDWYKTRSEDTLYHIYSFVTAPQDMLKKTKGVYIRDINDTAINEYLKGDTSWEASKDQIVGLVTGMYMIYKHCDNGYVRDNIRISLRPLDLILRTHAYFLYKTNNKPYDSDNRVVLFYDSVEPAMREMMGCWRFYNYNDQDIIKVFSVISDDSLKLKMGLIRKEITINDFLSFVNTDLTNSFGSLNIFTALSNFPWLNDVIQKIPSDEFSVNLTYYAMLLRATQSKERAQQVITTLDDERVMKLKHLNLASLYVYACNKYSIRGARLGFYQTLLLKDKMMYPSNGILPPMVIPGAEGLDGHVDTMNHFIRSDWTTNFSPNWGTQIGIQRTNAVSGFYDSGVMYCLRYLLANYK